MNKELEEAIIKSLNYKERGTCVISVEILEEVLNYIDNSISKEVIDKERIKQRTKLLYCNRAKNKAILDNDKEEIERQERLINILKVNIKSLEDILYERVNT